MSCAACAARVEKTLNRQPGVCSASVNYAAATATVEYDSGTCSPEALRTAIQNAGYDLVITAQEEKASQEADEAHNRRFRQLKFRATWAIVLAVPISVISMFSWICREPDIFYGYCPPQLYSGWDVISLSVPGNSSDTARQTWTHW